MSEAALEVLLHGLALAFWLGLPVVVAGALSGVLAGLVQSLTTWSDPVLAFLPRLLAVALAWGACAPWIAGEAVGFARGAWAALAGAPP